MRYVQAPLHFFRVVRAALRLAKTHGVDLVRGNDPYWTGLFALIAARLCRLPFCVSIHTDYRKSIELDRSIAISSVLGSHRLAGVLERFVLSRADMVMPIRESLRARAVEQGARRDRIRVIPHGIDLSPFDAPPAHDVRSRFDLRGTERIVSFVGRLSRDNYIGEVLDAVRKLGGQRSDFALVVAGGGKEEAAVRQRVAEDSVLRERVRLVGFQPRQVCLDLRRASAVSLCLKAGFSLIEACAAGRPVVAYDVEWHSELVRDGDTGFLVREHDVDGVVRALGWLLDHPDDGERMGRAARALAFQRHDVARTSATKVQWYSELLSQGPRA
jgi:glycosyltransferase involved in cell wall biosynthesis